MMHCIQKKIVTSRVLKPEDFRAQASDPANLLDQKGGEVTVSLEARDGKNLP